MLPNFSSAALTAAAICALSVTSSARGSAVSGKPAVMSWTASTFRAVTTALCPDASTASASARPSPVEQPVMSHVAMGFPFRGFETGFVRHLGAVPPSCVCCQFVGAVAVVVRVDGDAGGHQLVDAVQHLGRQLGVRGREVGLQLFHGAWSHD